MSEPRRLSTIAEDIAKHWPKVWFGAVPYLRAMHEMNTVSEAYGFDDGRSIVHYFLSNAKTWRGEHARRLKAELKELL